VVAPVIFRFRTGKGKASQGGGFTRDISKDAAFIVCNGDCPPPQTPVALEIVLPSRVDSAMGPLLKGTGRVVRHNGSGERNGFAAEAVFSNGSSKNRVKF
jgi:hypothetical protein